MRVCPGELEIPLVGEAPCNDGTAVAAFVLVSKFAAPGRAVHLLDAVGLARWEVAGGLAYGARLGAVAYRMLRRVDDHSVDILVTLAVDFDAVAFAAGAIAALLVPGARFVSVATPLLALSLPHGQGRDLFVTITYLMAGSTIFRQGLTLGRVVRRLQR